MLEDSVGIAKIPVWQKAKSILPRLQRPKIRAKKALLLEDSVGIAKNTGVAEGQIY